MPVYGAMVSHPNEFFILNLFLFLKLSAALSAVSTTPFLLHDSSWQLCALFWAKRGCILCDSCSSIPDLQGRGAQIQKGKTVILAPEEKQISQIIAPQRPEDTCNHWGRCQSNNAVLHRCSEHQYLAPYCLGNAPSNFTATSLLSRFVGPL